MDDCGIRCKYMSKYGLKTLNGKNMEFYSWYDYYYYLTLKNGQMLAIWINNDGKIWRDVYIDVDINGISGPNMYGKDVFEFYITNDGVKLYGTTRSDSDLKRNCSKSLDMSDAGKLCGALIQRNGWKIPDDYNW